MTENKRLEQETRADHGATSHSTGRDYKRSEDAREELYSISPVFRKTAKTEKVQPTAEQWREFSRDLNAKLESSDSPFFRTLRDRIVAGDHSYFRWFWIIVALIAATIIAAIVALSMYQQPQIATANLSAPVIPAVIRILPS